MNRGFSLAGMVRPRLGLNNTTTFGRLRCSKFRTAERPSFDSEIDGARKVIHSENGKGMFILFKYN